MLNPKINSYESLLSLALLSLLVGFSSTACRSTEAAANLSKTAVVTTTDPNKSSKDEQTVPPTNVEVALDSEIDFGDAYVRNDPLTPPPISAEAAGEESEPLKEVGTSTPPVDDSYIAEEEREEFFFTGTPVVNISVPQVRASLERGLPYAEARAMIISNGWKPIVDPTIDTTYDASLRSMHEMGYVEADACSGSGLGFCNMSFEGKDDIILYITLTTSSELPNVWDWDVNTR